MDGDYLTSQILYFTFCGVIIWRATLIFVGITGLSLSMAALTFFTSEKVQNFFMIAAALILIRYFIQLNNQDTFRQAVKFYLPLTVISFLGFSIAYVITGYLGTLFCSLGLIVSLVASWVQVSRVSLHQHFNHNDLFHVIQILGMFLMYRGGMEIPVF